MKLVLTDTKILKDSISIISDLVTEVTLNVKPETVELVAMDPANVAMVIFKLLGSAFADYEIKETTRLGINLADLKQVLRRTKPNDTITLTKKDEKLKLQFKGDSTRTFSIPLIDIEEKEQKIPELAFPVTIETHAHRITEAIQDVDIVAESVTFQCDKNRLLISAEGDLSKAKIEITGEGTTIKTTNDNEAKAKYSVEYLKKMIDANKLADKVNVSFNNDYPLKLDYKTIDKLQLTFILAPRVENE